MQQTLYTVGTRYTRHQVTLAYERTKTADRILTFIATLNLHRHHRFLRAKAARLSHRNSVCPSACHTGGSVKKRCKIGLPNLHRRLPGRL